MLKIITAGISTILPRVPLAVLAVFLPLFVAADESPQEDQQSSPEEVMAAAERVFSSIEALQQQIEAASAQFYADCLRVIPNRSVCTCLREQRPALLSFESYVQLTYHEAGIIQRSSELSEDDQEMFRATIRARDKCMQ